MGLVLFTDGLHSQRRPTVLGRPPSARVVLGRIPHCLQCLDVERLQIHLYKKRTLLRLFEIHQRDE